MKRPARIALNLLGPPALAVTFLLLGWIVFTAATEGFSRMHSFDGVLGFALGMLVMGYAYALLPSLAHALFLERIYRRSPPHTWAAVGFSTLSGLASGLLFAVLILAFTLHDSIGPSPIWMALSVLILGALVGFTLGLMIRLCSARAVLQPAPDPAYASSRNTASGG